MNFHEYQEKDNKDDSGKVISNKLILDSNYQYLIIVDQSQVVEIDRLANIPNSVVLTLRRSKWGSGDPVQIYKLDRVSHKPPITWYDGEAEYGYEDPSDWKRQIGRRQDGCIYAINPNGKRVDAGSLICPNGCLVSWVNPELGLQLNEKGQLAGEDLVAVRKLVAEHLPVPTAEERLKEAEDIIRRIVNATSAIGRDRYIRDAECWINELIQDTRKEDGIT